MLAIFVVVLCSGLGVTASEAARSSALANKVWSRAESAHTAKQHRNSVQTALLTSAAIAPVAGSTNVPLNGPVVVASSAGVVSDVHVVGNNGAPVTGNSTQGGRSWWSSSALAPNTDYHVDATVTGSTGVQVHLTSSFHTITPLGYVGVASSFPTEGMTVGVAQAIVVHLDHTIDDPMARAAIVSHLVVNAPKGVTGGWHWFTGKELHFRPRTYWPAGAHITLDANLEGWNAGNDFWGQGHQQLHFSIGDAHVSVANLATHSMVVTSNGKIVATYPMSGGRPKYPTMNGNHVVLDREAVVHMVSSTNGIPVNSPDGYDEYVYNDVHISDSGEYVHAAPWSVGSQGRQNVSHGCINLSTPDSAAFFAFSRIGDMVQVVGGPRPPELGDHGVMDWDTPWNQWMPAVVTH